MRIENKIDLIGDFLGTIPAMVALAEREVTIGVRISDNSNVRQIMNMIPAELRINYDYTKDEPDYTLDLHKAFAFATQNGLHMTQAYFDQVGLPTPINPVRPSLKPFKSSSIEKLSADYILSPFSRSLPENQKWPQSRWQNLVDEMSDCTFCIVGSNTDPIDFIEGTNVIKRYGHQLSHVANLMLDSLKGIISVVTGTSHMAYALDVTNFLFTNQGDHWGNNPDAKRFEGFIPDISVNSVIGTLQKYEI